MKILLAGAPLLLALPLLCGSASAQVGGSYRHSCSNIDQDGPILSADCDAPGGRSIHSSLDVSRCGGQGVANSFGRLTCGGMQGRAEQDGRRRRFSDDDGDDGFHRPRFGGPRFAPPPDEDDGGYTPHRRYYNPDDE